MIELAEIQFNAKTDPKQISFTENDMEYMQSLHPACMNEISNEEGPICWVTVIPTSKEIMTKMLQGEINENQLLQNTTLDTPLQAIYLCSALTLPEFRMQNITFNVTVKAIQKMKENHPIEALFAWPFTVEGQRLSQKIASQLQLPIFFCAASK